MLIIGLAGGIASGKSYVAAEFGRLGAVVIDADRLGHEVLRNAEVREELLAEFGAEILDERGEIDRRALARLVFSDTPTAQSRLGMLERISHPRIEALIRNRIDEFRAAGYPAVVVDAAVMFKSGWDRWCDRIVFVECSLETRIRRAEARGWSRRELLDREARQTPLAEKRARATDLVDNDDQPRVPLADQVRQLWAKWGLDAEKYRKDREMF